MRSTLKVAVIFILAAAPAHADEWLKGIACRSVHLAYSAPECVAFYNELTVEKSADGTYFMAAGWSKGYFGIQELASGKKLVLFSVWDPTSGNNPQDVDDSKRVKMLYKDDAVRVRRFGDEGTGGQSFFDYDWKIGQTYRFFVTAKPDGDSRTAYSGYLFVPEKSQWKHLVTFSTITSGTLLTGYYSFVEDFRRNKISTTKERLARFGNGWVKPAHGDWLPLDKAHFTADANPVLNIDAGATAGRFFLATGGDIENKTTKLWEIITRGQQGSSGTPPADLPGFE
jgi:hypothetical protein